MHDTSLHCRRTRCVFSTVSTRVSTQHSFARCPHGLSRQHGDNGSPYQGAMRMLNTVGLHGVSGHRLPGPDVFYINMVSYAIFTGLRARLLFHAKSGACCSAFGIAAGKHRSLHRIVMRFPYGADRNPNRPLSSHGKAIQIENPNPYERQILADQQWVFQAHQDHMHAAR